MYKYEGRVAWPSLFVLYAGLSLLAASLFTDRWYQWGGIALLALAWAPWRAYPANSLGIVVGLYCAWLLTNAILITPVYASESLYQPLMLFGGFAAVAAFDRARQIQLFRMGVVLVSALVLLGFLQYFFNVWRLDHNPTRAAGTFMTPNTLATAINLFLAPLAALYLVRGSAGLFALLLWLFAGLIATESRGGMLAFLAGTSFIAICLKPGGLRRSAARGTVLLAGFAGVWALMIGAARLAEHVIRGAADAGPTAATWLGRATWDRTDIYVATLRLILERPIAGAGANMFFPLFETVKPDSLRDGDYYYAHSDYLQIWLEFGAPGILLLVLLVSMALVLALRSCWRAPQDPLPLLCGAALATCFAHAVVDFPLYVPFILMIAGAFLGALARQSGGSMLPDAALRFPRRAFEWMTPAIRWALAFAVLAWLAQPMIAEMAVNRSIALLARGEARDGIYWQSVARRLEPRHPVHYWAEATIWRGQAILTKNPTLAAQADALLVEGMRANPYDVANRLARIELHRRHSDLLKNAAAPAEVLSWAESAAALRPQNLAVQAELARSLAYAGRTEQARSVARALVEKYPDLKFPRRLAAEL